MNPADPPPDDDYVTAMMERIKADAFARALDARGWMIVQQPQFEDGRRWPMEGPPYPSWAEQPTPPVATPPHDITRH
jgi:hypothetical protein